MSEVPAKPVYFVNAYSDPVVVRLEGRACFTNSAELQTFLNQMVEQGRTRFVMDFQHCAGMDSTFLGVLAGTALELRRKQPPGSLVLCRVGRRNLELVRNLGLYRLLTVDAGDVAMDFGPGATALACAPDRNALENARLVLEAHENLVAADPANQGKFQDVVAYLRNRVTQDSRPLRTGGNP
ncbi:MAG: STAS domain-containing protein [Opitutaceae bacterium]|nr:STAS domain-containing protein [Opitutaceae bacterium]